MAATPPGWYQDPHTPGQQRWWDGAQWVPRTRVTPPDAPPAPDPPPKPAAHQDPSPLGDHPSLTQRITWWRARAMAHREIGFAFLAVLVAAALVVDRAVTNAVPVAYPINHVLGALVALPFVVAAIYLGFALTDGWSPYQRVGLLAVGLIALDQQILVSVLWTLFTIAIVVAIGAAVIYGLTHKSPLSGTGTGTTTVKRGPGSHIRSDGTPKISYPTLAKAQVVATRQSKQENRVVNAYKCATCPKFHVGHDN